jgi:RHS repeat-associated protein
MDDQLATLTGNGLDISYKYNVDGIRTQKTVNGVTTTYHLDGDIVTYETDGTDEIYYTYNSNDKLVSMNLNGEKYFYLRNIQGDITGLVDQSGTEVVSYQYDTWGKLVSVSGTLADTVGEKNPYRYRGYRYDLETGLYYLNARYYNPEWKRFLNADSYGGSIGDLLSHNVFAYALNNPVMYADPSGNIPWDTIIDVGWTVYEGVKAIISPTEENMNNFKWSLASIFIPYMPGSYAKHAADGLGGAFSKGSKSTSKSTSNSGSKTSKNVAETGSKGKANVKSNDVTPGGLRFTDHGTERANERGFSPQNIDSIVQNNKKTRKSKIDDLGRKTWEYVDKRGNKVVLNEQNGIVSVHSSAEGGVYIPKLKK